MILWHQGHAQWPGKKEREHAEVGAPMFPAFLMKTTALYMLVFAGYLLPWLETPYRTAQATTASHDAVNQEVLAATDDSMIVLSVNELPAVRDEAVCPGMPWVGRAHERDTTRSAGRRGQRPARSIR